MHDLHSNAEAQAMYAIIKTGGKQYRVAEGQTLKVEKIPTAPGEQAYFEEVLMVSTPEELHIGNPLVKDAKVEAEVIDHVRGPKIKILKFRRRKHHMKRMGHRQDYTEVKVSGILIGENRLQAPEEKKIKAASKTKKQAKPKSEKSVKKKPIAKKQSSKKAVKKK